MSCQCQTIEYARWVCMYGRMSHFYCSVQLLIVVLLNPPRYLFGIPTRSRIQLNNNSFIMNTRWCSDQCIRWNIVDVTIVTPLVKRTPPITSENLTFKVNKTTIINLNNEGRSRVHPRTLTLLVWDIVVKLGGSEWRSRIQLNNYAFILDKRGCSDQCTRWNIFSLRENQQNTLFFVKKRTYCLKISTCCKFSISQRTSGAGQSGPN